MISIGKYKSYIVLKKFHEIDDYKIVANIIKCFCKEDERILFPWEYYSDDMERFEKYHKYDIEFINQRTILTSDEWIDFFGRTNKLKRKVPWYEVKEIDEIVRALQIDSLFKCIIIKKDILNVRKYSYVMFHMEEDIGTSLNIKETIKGDFNKNVLKKIVQIIDIQGEIQ